jgi:hypothetical protein
MIIIETFAAGCQHCRRRTVMIISFGCGSGSAKAAPTKTGGPIGGITHCGGARLGRTAGSCGGDGGSRTIGSCALPSSIVIVPSSRLKAGAGIGATPSCSVITVKAAAKPLKSSGGGSGFTGSDGRRASKASGSMTASSGCQHRSFAGGPPCGRRTRADSNVCPEHFAEAMATLSLHPRPAGEAFQIGGGAYLASGIR